MHPMRRRVAFARRSIAPWVPSLSDGAACPVRPWPAHENVNAGWPAKVVRPARPALRSDVEHVARGDFRTRPTPRQTDHRANRGFDEDHVMVAVPLFVVVFRAVSHAIAFQADRLRRALMSFASCRRFRSPPTGSRRFRLLLRLLLGILST